MGSFLLLANELLFQASLVLSVALGSVCFVDALKLAFARPVESHSEHFLCGRPYLAC